MFCLLRRDREQRAERFVGVIPGLVATAWHAVKEPAVVGVTAFAHNECVRVGFDFGDEVFDGEADATVDLHGVGASVFLTRTGLSRAVLGQGRSTRFLIMN